ncbi:UDP-glucuronate decarboxylase [hydrothermal vent metagenome]|uniref:UDP-glucuronate decarboxylase n=1 Tax=hydrothermal vent metagenome TaxID=652676 RepID=A0A3B1CL19_9ZZZZ
MSRVLITGGAGFIGSYLCERFLSEGDEVACVDNLVTGVRGNVENINSAGFKFYEQDVSKGLNGVAGPFDFVLHFASPASPPDYLRIPIETLLVSSAGTHAALDIALENNAVFLLASTSEVYGDPEINPQQEDYWGNVNPVGPRSCYDEAKRYAEAATMAYRRARGLDTRIVRIFNTFGPRMRKDDGRAVSNFICQALEGKDLTVYGDGGQTRSFCYVSDLVDGIVKLLKSDYQAPVNLGNPEEMSILNLAKMALEYTGSSSNIINKSLPVDDPKVRKPDISRAKKELGWAPKVTLAEGFRKTVEYYKTIIEKESPAP